MLGMIAPDTLDEDGLYRRHAELLASHRSAIDMRDELNMMGTFRDIKAIEAELEQRGLRVPPRP